MSICESNQTLFMQRCFDLARLGAGRVSPNPMVGAVLEYQGRIIGEGFHQAYGQPHAEVNAVASVAAADRPFIPKSTLYVSLEPCCIYGKTPPCTDLIIRHKIPRVVIATLDQTPGVAGAGVRRLVEAGVEVETNLLKAPGERLAAIRNTFVSKGRPYVILKYAITADGIMGGKEGAPLWISNPYAKRLVHKWRGETDAILVSARTAQLDNAKLTNRLFFGPSPRRIVLDRKLSLPAHLAVFDGTAPTIIAHDPALSPPQKESVSYLPVLKGRDLRPLLRALHKEKISSILVEGGAQVLHSFLDQNLWDEARIFQSGRFVHEGLPAPLPPTAPDKMIKLDTDRLYLYHAQKQSLNLH